MPIMIPPQGLRRPMYGGGYVGPSGADVRECELASLLAAGWILAEEDDLEEEEEDEEETES